MSLGKGVLAGKKTYVTAGLGAIGFIAAYLMGDIALADALLGVFNAIGLATLRKGIKTDTK